MKDVLHLIIQSRMHGNTGGLIHDDEFLIVMHDRLRPVDTIHGKALRVQMDSDMLPRRKESIRVNPLPILVDSSESDEPFAFLDS